MKYTLRPYQEDAVNAVMDYCVFQHIAFICSEFNVR